MNTTTIQISRANADRLETVTGIMRRIFPDLFGVIAPTKDQAVGFLCGQFLGDLTDDEIKALADDWRNLDLAERLELVGE